MRSQWKNFWGGNPFEKDWDIIVVVIIFGWNDSAKVASWPRLGPFQRQSPWNAAAYLKPWGALRIRILLWRQRRLGWQGNRKEQNADSGSWERWLEVRLSCSHVQCAAKLATCMWSWTGGQRGSNACFLSSASMPSIYRHGVTRRAPFTQTTLLHGAAVATLWQR